MGAELFLAFAVVLLAWVGAALMIRRWGPGTIRRQVRCPERLRRATVLAVQTEAGYGAIRASDVLACNLLGTGPVTCDKRCLARL